MMIEPFLWNALLGGFGMALMCGPLGCFTIWLRLSYFGDAIAHAALLGVSIALLLAVDFTLGVLLSSLLIALLLTWLERDRRLASDALIGILAHGALAGGLVLLSLSGRVVDVNAILFGDILALTPRHLTLIFLAAGVVCGLLAAFWRPLILLVVNADIAQVEGVPVARLRAMLVLLMALAVAVSIQAVGMLLVTSLLIIPAAAARAMSRAPHTMAALSVPVGMGGVMGGLLASYRFDAPSGPSIILALVALFALSRLKPRAARR